MDNLPEHIKKLIVEEELERLVNDNYISQETYDNIIEAQYHYYEDFYQTVSDLASAELLGDKAKLAEASESALANEQQEDMQYVKRTSLDMQEADTYQAKESYANAQQIGAQECHKQQSEAEQSNVQDTYAQKATQSGPASKQSQVPKRKLTDQEIRERNITWLLGVGVVFLLIAGTFLATSTWYMLPNIVKTLLIALVAGLFFGLAILTDKLLKITKTGFAFYVLGALFLPIVILSIGFYGQLGYYLSVEGDGKYLLGALGSLVLLPIYLAMARKLHARLFVWLSYVFLTFSVGFFLGWLNLPIDGFYLGMVLFNTGLIFFYRYANKQEKWSFYVGDFVKYMQANLILTSVLVIVFYDSALMNGFNLMITATLYLMMIYVTNYRQYHYVFTLLFVYGAYQMIEFQALQELDAILYASLGFVFLFLPRLFRDEHQVTQIFQYTSVIISGLAFVFISSKAMVLTMEEPSIALSIAYMLIAFNFLYAVNKFHVNERVFSYISTVFMMIGFNELVLVGQEIFGFPSIHLPLFMIASIVYIVLGCLHTHPFLEKIRISSRDVSVLLMLWLLFIHGFMADLWETGVMFILLSMVAVLLAQYETRHLKYVTAFATWIHPLCFGIAMMLFYVDLVPDVNMAAGNLPPPSIVAGVIGLALSLLWKQVKQAKPLQQTFYDNAFYMAHIFYLVGMLQALNYINFQTAPMTRVAIFIGGLAFAYVLYRKTRLNFTAYLISTNALALYLVSLYAAHQAFDLMSPSFLAFQFTIASLILFMIGFIFNEKQVLFRHAFWWVAHLFLPLALFMELFTTDEIGFWPIIVTGIVYAISLYRTKENTLIHIYLYALLTMIPLAVSYFIMLIEVMDLLKYSMFITIAIYFVAWFMVSDVWKTRLKFYIMPASILSLFFYANLVIDNLIIFILTILLGGLITWFLLKERWEIYTVLPLGLLYIAIFTYGLPNDALTYGMLLAFALSLFTAGTFLFKTIYQARGKELPTFDWFTVIGFIALISLHIVASDAILDRILPDVLIIIALILQKSRLTGKNLSKWIVVIAALYAFKPYYTLLDYVTIPAVIETELYVLPWIAVVSMLKKVVIEQHKTTMNYLQWGALIIIAGILMKDGLDSGTIYDALILGTLAVVSMLAGMQLRIKSFFFVGLTVLLLNFLLQTRPFWGNLPWWVYLLVVGILLITVASSNEWYKQKKAEGKVSIVKKWYDKISGTIKGWE